MSTHANLIFQSQFLPYEQLGEAQRGHLVMLARKRMGVAALTAAEVALAAEVLYVQLCEAGSVTTSGQILTSYDGWCATARSWLHMYGHGYALVFNEAFIILIYGQLHEITPEEGDDCGAPQSFYAPLDATLLTERAWRVDSWSTSTVEQSVAAVVIPDLVRINLRTSDDTPLKL